MRERFRDEADAWDAGRTGGSSRAAYVVAGLVYLGDRERYIGLINKGDDEARGVTVSTEPESEPGAWDIIGGEEPVAESKDESHCGRELLDHNDSQSGNRRLAWLRRTDISTQLGAPARQLTLMPLRG